MTKARVLQDVHQEPLNKGDIVVVDGYVRGADDRPYAVVIRESDGVFSLVQTHLIVAIGGTY